MLGKVLKIWLIIVFTVTILLGTVYLAIQQSYRQDANDPQIQMAEDTANAMKSGTFYPGLKNLNPVDIANSLSPFTLVYDTKGDIISSNALLNDQTPTLPSGVLDYVRSHGEDRITWQPANNVRIAAVIVPFTSDKVSGVVLAGRNIREVEKREDKLTFQIAIGWAAATFGSLVVICFLEFLFPKKK